MQQSIKVELVTSSPNGAENLGLQYLYAALEEAGHHPKIRLFRGITEFDAIATQIIKTNVKLVGVSILSGYTAIDALAFIHLIRKRGYTGHVVCGGIYATLCRHRLLRDNPGIDSVLRHDGEISFVKLADAIASNAPLQNVAGLTTITGDGLPAPVNDCSNLNISPKRFKPLLYAGVPAAKISAVRGCHGHCTYCGLKALRKEAVNEARSLGMAPSEMKEKGIGGMRRRSVVSVADEMAQLYHQHGVRFYHFVDENHLPADPQQAAQLIHGLCDALDERGVADRAISMMLRADVATKPVAAALERLGLVRGLLGVESTNTNGLGILKRGNIPEVNKMAIKNLSRISMMYHFNIMLIHPESTIQTIDAEIRGLIHVSGGGLIDIFTVEPFEGTAVFEKLQREERLEGGPLLWHYWPKEDAARRFSEYMQIVKRELFGFTHLTAYAYEALGAYSVARKLHLLNGSVLAQDKQAAALISKHNKLWIQLLKKLVVYSKHPPSDKALSIFLKQIQVDSANLILEFREFKTQSNDRSTTPIISETYYAPTAAAVTVALSILAASACSHVSSIDKEDTDLIYSIDTSVDSASGTTPHNDYPGLDADVDTDTDADIDTESDSTNENGECIDWRLLDSEVQTIENTATESGCLDLYTICRGEDDFRYAFVLDDDGRVVDMVKDWGTPLSDEIIDCYLTAVKDQIFPCLNSWAYSQVWRCDYILLE